MSKNKVLKKVLEKKESFSLSRTFKIIYIYVFIITYTNINNINIVCIYTIMQTYETKYGKITLYKNEAYIGNHFNHGIYWDEDTLLKLKEYIK